MVLLLLLGLAFGSEDADAEEILSGDEAEFLLFLG
jgi:hypothetical protein